jgi:pSer/pThr/pTyr-binding forkhead associated (FHA) protein
MSQPSLLLTPDDPTSQYPRLLVLGEAVTLGRVEGNDLVVPDPTVSSRHARFAWDREKGLFEVVDLGSANGTFLNGRQIMNAHVKVGDELIFGKVVRYRVREWSRAADPQTTLPLPSELRLKSRLPDWAVPAFILLATSLVILLIVSGDSSAQPAAPPPTTSNALTVDSEWRFVLPPELRVSATPQETYRRLRTELEQSLQVDDERQFYIEAAISRGLHQLLREHRDIIGATREEMATYLLLHHRRREEFTARLVEMTRALVEARKSSDPQQRESTNRRIERLLPSYLYSPSGQGENPARLREWSDYHTAARDWKPPQESAP